MMPCCSLNSCHTDRVGDSLVPSSGCGLWTRGPVARSVVIDRALPIRQIQTLWHLVVTAVDTKRPQGQAGGTRARGRASEVLARRCWGLGLSSRASLAWYFTCTPLLPRTSSVSRQSVNKVHDVDAGTLHASLGDSSCSQRRPARASEPASQVACTCTLPQSSVSQRRTPGYIPWSRILGRVRRPPRRPHSATCFVSFRFGHGDHGAARRAAFNVGSGMARCFDSHVGAAVVSLVSSRLTVRWIADHLTTGAVRS